MSLTNSDVLRLERAGANGFFEEWDDGTLRLKNVNGGCVFLVDGACSVYASRPDGCVLYPLILYTDVDEVGVHELCPFGNEFRFSSGDVAWLRNSIAQEEAEVVQRRLVLSASTV